MASRSYGQFCGLARAMEIVGERWAMLLVRDLILGPKRYTDLRRGLPRIPTNILSTRLKELEQAGVVTRRVLPRPAASVVYELTDYGRELDDIVLRLGRWGAKSLGERRSDDTVTAELLILSLHTMFDAEAARGERLSFELRLYGFVIHVRVEDGTLHATEGAADEPDLVIETELSLKAFYAGQLCPREAVADGSVRLTGEPELLERFLKLFHMPAPSPPVVTTR